MSFGHLDATGCGEYWRAGYAGQGVTIGVIDSGVNPHRDFGDRLLPEVSVCGASGDDTGHGTHVAGLAAGAKSGAAPGAKVLPVKVVKANKAGIGTVIDGFRAALEWRGGDGRPLDLVNASISVSESGCGGRLKEFERVIELLAGQGTTVVCAAGNYGKDRARRYPACFEAPVVVANVDRGLRIAEASSRRKEVDFAEIGTSLYSCSHRSRTGYVRKSGTSMASPVTAGLLACIISKELALRGTRPSPDELFKIALAYSVDLGDKGRDLEYGYGFLRLR